VYELGEKIGEGMHSSVYKCFKANDFQQKCPFAVKITREDDEEKKLAHRNEYRLTSGLTHPNVVASHDFFENEFTSEIHLVMPFINGTELSECDLPLTPERSKVLIR
jgi:serine/threonine protein kinase